MTQRAARPASDLRTTNLLLGILAACAAGVVLLALREVLVPLFVALFLSYAIMPLVRLGRRLRVPVAISLVIGLALFVLIMVVLGRVVYGSAAEFAEGLPELEAKLAPYVADLFELLEVPAGAVPGVQDGSIEWGRVLRSDAIRGFANDQIGYLFGWLGSLTLVVFFLIFIVLDRGHEHLDRRIIAAFSAPGTESARPVLQLIHRRIERYILVKTGIALLNGALGGLILWIFGVPFAAMFGAVTFVLDFIPNIGSVVATVLPVLVALVHFDSPLSAVWVGIALTVVQVGIANFLEPLVLGKQLHLNTITVLLALVFWGWLWGIAGMVLSVPLAVAFKIVAQQAPALRAVDTLMGDDDPPRAKPTEA